MSEEKKLITVRFPVDLLEKLKDKQEYYGDTRTDAIIETSREGLRAAHPNVYQVEVSTETEKRIDKIAEERDADVEEAVVQLIERGIDVDADDVFVAEFPRDKTRDIKKFAERERLDREGAIRQLVEKGIEADRGGSATNEVAGVGVSGKIVIFGLILFAISSAVSPETVPFYTEQLSQWLAGFSLLLAVGGVVFFVTLPLMPYFDKVTERLESYSKSFVNRK